MILKTTIVVCEINKLLCNECIFLMVSGAVKMHAERTHLCNLSNRAKAEEECDGEIKEYEVATSAAKAHRCSRIKRATTYACNAAAALSSYPSSAILTPVSILCTTKAVFPQHALVETYFQSSQAYEAHERALSWETSPRAWLANVRAIEKEKGLIPVPASSSFLLVCVVPA